MSFSERMGEVLGASGRMSAKALTELSDPTRSQVADASEVWAAAPVRRRLRVIAALSAAAKENVGYDFKQLFLFALDDPDPQVRRAAVEALWEAEGAVVQYRLIGALSTDPDAGVRAAAARSLGRYAYSAAVGDLNQSDSEQVLAALEQALSAAGSDGAVRRAVVEALSYLGSERVESEIEALYGQDPDDQASALNAMGRSMDARWAGAVLESTSSGHSQVRSAAMHAAGEIGLEQSVPALARGLHDTDDHVRSVAIWALGQIGSEQALKVLRSFGADAPEDVQAEVDAALDEALYSGDFE